jgi:hypothetical protein
VIDNPPGGEGHAHQDGLDAAASLEAKGGAAVIHQVKLHIPAHRVAVSQA